LFVTAYGCRCPRGLSTHANDDSSQPFYSEKIDPVKIPSINWEGHQNKNNVLTSEEQQLTSLLMELPDRVGVLHDVLRFFWKYDVNIRRIESRPSQFGKFDFFVDVEGSERDGRLGNLRASLKEYGVEKLLTLGEKEGKVEFIIIFVLLEFISVLNY